MAKHPHYDLLNLLGYGLAKFDTAFIQEFGFSTKSAFFDYFVTLGIAETASVVKNRMDLFDPYFENGRKGWWQKAEIYHHRKELIDSMFGGEDVESFAQIIKLIIKDETGGGDFILPEKPIIRSKFKRLQETGLEAENYFILHFDKTARFSGGQLTDARLYGDGYDFQVDVDKQTYLAEVKGIRDKKGKVRLTAREYEQASVYKEQFVLSLVKNLDAAPQLVLIENPLKQFEFAKRVSQQEIVEYRSCEDLY